MTRAAPLGLRSLRYSRIEGRSLVRGGCSEPSYNAAALPEGLHLLLTHPFPAVELRETLPNCGFLFLVQDIDAGPARFDLTGRFGKLFLVLFGPSLNSAQNFLRSLGHADIIARGTPSRHVGVGRPQNPLALLADRRNKSA